MQLHAVFDDLAVTNTVVERRPVRRAREVRRHGATAFGTISTVYRTPADRLLVEQPAVVLARHTSARVQAHGNSPDVDASPDVVVMSASDACTFARRLLDSGTPVVVVPARPGALTRIARIGIGYDGGKPAESALEAASALVAACPVEVGQVDVVHVDNSASGVSDAQDHVLNSRRSAVIEWWLEDVAARLTAPVRVVRAVGDPADELAQLSEELDLLVVGTRGRAPLRRALTGSVSAELIRTTRCPLLVVPPTRFSPDAPRTPSGGMDRSALQPHRRGRHRLGD